MPLDLEAFRAQSNPARVPCQVSVLPGTLDDHDAEVFLQAVNDPSITATAIARVLTGRGHHISAGSIQRHRRGDCLCDA